MNKRALSLVLVAALILVGLSWALGELRELQRTVADHGGRIEQLERR